MRHEQRFRKKTQNFVRIFSVIRRLQAQYHYPSTTHNYTLPSTLYFCSIYHFVHKTKHLTVRPFTTYGSYFYSESFTGSTFTCKGSSPFWVISLKSLRFDWKTFHLRRKCETALNSNDSKLSYLLSVNKYFLVRLWKEVTSFHNWKC